MRLNEKICLEPITSDGAQRSDIVDFLFGLDNEGHDKKFWNLRLSNWWENNPFYNESLPRGWILKADKQIVGFLGIIATDYEYQGKKYKALTVTTWQVLKEYRTHSITLFYKFYSYKNKYILLDTTPSKVVIKILEAYGFNSNRKIINLVFPIKYNFQFSLFDIFLFFWQKLYALVLPKKKCIIVETNKEIKVKELTGKFKNYLQKSRSCDYLKWYLSFSPAKRIIGSFDKDRELSSFVVIEEGRIKKFNALRVIDYCMGDETGEEILGIVNYICDNPKILNINNDYRFLIFTLFPQNELNIKIPFYILGIKKKTGFYYTLPPPLESVKMLNFAAEGDVGL